MAPIRDILEELENMDDTEWPEGMVSTPVERMDSTGKGGGEGGREERLRDSHVRLFNRPPH